MNEKKRMSRERRLIKRAIIIWGVLGLIGLVGIVYALINWVGELCVRQEENDLSEPVVHGEPILESESGFLQVMPEGTVKEPEEVIQTQIFWELYEANKELLVLVNREHALEDASYEDILCGENLNMDVTQATEPGNQWLVEHAHEYGFILRYPEGTEEITGIFYEPWHFRYVGKEVAIFLREQELTLEEFWEFLERQENI